MPSPAALLALLLSGCDAESVALHDRPRHHDPRDTAPDADTAPDTAPDTAEDTAPDGGACGDNVRNGAEECDGGDADACPNRCSSLCACPSARASDTLTLHMMDVGQGDGMLLVTPDGYTALVDAGDADHLEDVRDYLAAQDVALDFVFVSHFHSDHMGAMGALLREHPEVQYAFDAGGRYDSDAFEQYDLHAGDRRVTVHAGDTIDLGSSVLVDVLHADEGDADNENNNSVVLRITYGGVRFLLGGDCEYPVCESAFDPGPIDVYKVHHHGSWNGSSGLLLGEMEPKTALISVGADNDYGHPTEETLERLADVGATVWRTDLDGPIVVTSDGVGWETNGVPAP